MPEGCVGDRSGIGIYLEQHAVVELTLTVATSAERVAIEHQAAYDSARHIEAGAIGRPSELLAHPSETAETYLLQGIEVRAGEVAIETGDDDATVANSRLLLPPPECTAKTIGFGMSNHHQRAVAVSGKHEAVVEQVAGRGGVGKVTEMRIGSDDERVAMFGKVIAIPIGVAACAHGVGAERNVHGLSALEIEVAVPALHNSGDVRHIVGRLIPLGGYGLRGPNGSYLCNKSLRIHAHQYNMVEIDIPECSRERMRFVCSINQGHIGSRGAGLFVLLGKAELNRQYSPAITGGTTGSPCEIAFRTMNHPERVAQRIHFGEDHIGVVAIARAILRPRECPVEESRLVGGVDRAVVRQQEGVTLVVGANIVADGLALVVRGRQEGRLPLENSRVVRHGRERDGQEKGEQKRVTMHSLILKSMTYACKDSVFSADVQVFVNKITTFGDCAVSKPAVILHLIKKTTK